MLRAIFSGRQFSAAVLSKLPSDARAAQRHSGTELTRKVSFPFQFLGVGSAFPSQIVTKMLLDPRSGPRVLKTLDMPIRWALLTATITSWLTLKKLESLGL